MGKDEMDKVRLRQNQLIVDHLDSLVFYYGVTDKWCPIDYYHEIKDFADNFLKTTQQSNQTGKGHNVLLDSYGMEHGFVLFQKQCNIISKLIHKWLSDVFWAFSINMQYHSHVYYI